MNPKMVFHRDTFAAKERKLAKKEMNYKFN